MEVGKEGDYIPIKSLHCHDQNDSCIVLLLLLLCFCFGLFVCLLAFVVVLVFVLFCFLWLFHNNLPSCHRKCICNYHFVYRYNNHSTILLLCFLYLFVEFMITINEQILFKPRWAAMRAILMSHWFWGTKPQDRVHEPQPFRRETRAEAASSQTGSQDSDCADTMS